MKVLAYSDRSRRSSKARKSDMLIESLHSVQRDAYPTKFLAKKRDSNLRPLDTLEVLAAKEITSRRSREVREPMNCAGADDNVL